MTLAAILPGSLLAAGIYNLDSARNTAAPRDARKTGWTEAWGADEIEDLSRFILDTEAIGSLLSTPHPQTELILTQFRPAWVEQMILRMAKTPFVVVNSNHIASEATGPLPYLRDHEDSSKPPALVGRNHPSNITSPNPLAQNHILEYLKTERNIDLDRALTTSEQKSLSKCLMTLVQAELYPILTYLRYEDYDAWEQVYRRQYLHASSPRPSSNWFVYLHGRFQASLERLTMRQRLVEVTQSLSSIPRAVARAKEAYTALDMQLQRHGGKYILDTNTPTVVDAVVWAHLAEALCDVHLVVLLADFKNLVRYFQDLHKTYFEVAATPWEEWNRSQNNQNAFQQLPFKDEKKLNATGFKDAIDLMQTMSLQNHDLQEVLGTTKTKIASELRPRRTPVTETLFYRWRMGEDINRKAEETSSEQDDPQNELRKRIMRDQARYDQLWISGVVGVSAIAILLLQGNSKEAS